MGGVILAIDGQPTPAPDVAVALIGAVETGKELVITKGFSTPVSKRAAID